MSDERIYEVSIPIQVTASDEEQAQEHALDDLRDPDMEWDYFVVRSTDIERMEDCVPTYASLLNEIAIGKGAVVFADDLARGGMDPAHLRMMAGRWQEGGFEPAYLAGQIELLADACERFEGAVP